MINIDLHKNGFEIKNHATPMICAEVSILSWACANSVYYNDPSAKWNGGNGSGYLSLIFDPSNEKAICIFEEFKRNLKTWAEKNWPTTEVQINQDIE